MMVIFIAGLGNIPVTLYEAASLDGAGAWQRLRHITIPMMTPLIFYNMVIAIINSFQTFIPAQIITQGGPKAPPCSWCGTFTGSGVRKVLQHGLRCRALVGVLCHHLPGFTIVQKLICPSALGILRTIGARHERTFLPSRPPQDGAEDSPGSFCKSSRRCSSSPSCRPPCGWCRLRSKYPPKSSPIPSSGSPERPQWSNCSAHLRILAAVWPLHVEHLCRHRPGRAWHGHLFGDEAIVSRGSTGRVNLFFGLMISPCSSRKSSRRLSRAL